MMSYNSSLNKHEYYIIYLLGRYEKVTITKLCNILNIAPSTMRKILNNMERKGLIIRTHGGAVSIDSRQDEPLERKAILNISQKKAIAVAARDLIKDGETIALGDGSTIIELCHRLKNLRNLIVHTDSIVAATILMNCQNIEVRICSGIVQGKTGRIVGLDANKYFEGMHVDKTIISADAISVDDGVGNSNILVSHVERSMLQCADKKIVLCDYSKIGKSVLCQIVPIAEMDYLITDNATDSGLLMEIEKHGVNVIVTRPLF